MKKNLLIIISLFCLGIGTGNAQLTDIVDFGGTKFPKGENPYGDVVRSGNLLFGMAQSGGAHNDGLIFSVDSNGNNYKDILDFNGTNGSAPISSLTLSITGDTLFGATESGGLNGYGLVFSIDTNGSNYHDMFDFNFTNGSAPIGSLILSVTKDALFGMTLAGGIDDKGTIFSITNNGSNFNKLLDFGNANNGSNPNGPLILSITGDTLFGMTNSGGVSYGNIFSIPVNNASGYKDLWDFGASSDTSGSSPHGSLTFSGNKLYGMTLFGGTYASGNIFSISTNGANYKNLWNFDNGGDTNGSKPGGSLLLLGTVLYGMTSLGGLHSDGNIFSINITGSNYKDLIDFNGTNGKNPIADLLLVRDMFYGMAYSGGTNDSGVIFSFKDTAIHTITTGINKIVENTSLKVHPNPNNGIFNVVCHPELVSGSQTIYVYNVLGEQVLTEPLRSAQGDNLINLREQPDGIYLYRVIANTGELMGEGKLIIQK